MAKDQRTIHLSIISPVVFLPTHQSAVYLSIVPPSPSTMTPHPARTLASSKPTKKKSTAAGPKDRLLGNNIAGGTNLGVPDPARWGPFDWLYRGPPPQAMASGQHISEPSTTRWGTVGTVGQTFEDHSSQGGLSREPIAVPYQPPITAAATISRLKSNTKAIKAQAKGKKASTNGQQRPSTKTAKTEKGESGNGEQSGTSDSTKESNCKVPGSEVIAVRTRVLYCYPWPNNGVAPGEQHAQWVVPVDGWYYIPCPEGVGEGVSGFPNAAVFTVQMEGHPFPDGSVPPIPSTAAPLVPVESWWHYPRPGEAAGYDPAAWVRTDSLGAPAHNGDHYPSQEQRDALAAAAFGFFAAAHEEPDAPADPNEDRHYYPGPDEESVYSAAEYEQVDALSAPSQDREYPSFTDDEAERAAAYSPTDMFAVLAQGRDDRLWPVEEAAPSAAAYAPINATALPVKNWDYQSSSDDALLPPLELNTDAPPEEPYAVDEELLWDLIDTDQCAEDEGAWEMETDE